MAREEFVDENGIIPQVLPNYNLGKDDILFSDTVDLLSNDKEDAVQQRSQKFWPHEFLVYCQRISPF